MKKLLLILLCLFSFNTLTYASFPITENYTENLEILSLDIDVRIIGNKIVGVIYILSSWRIWP